MKKDYYEETIDIVKKLIEQEKHGEAQEILEQELKMPYVPLKYEATFVELLNDVRAKTSPDGAKGSYVSKDVALDYLLSEDKEQEIMGLELLRSHNLRFDKEVLKRRIETWPKEKSILKAYLFELLVEQEIDIDVQWDEETLMNPSNGSVMNDEQVAIAIDQVQHEFTQNPSQREMAEDELQRYLLITYPEVPVDGKQFGIAVSNVVKKMFDENIQLTPEQMEIFKKLKSA